MPESESLYTRLRQLAAEDPRQARTIFLEHFEANTQEGAMLLNQISRPGDGRLRQLVANSVRNHDQKHRIVAVLLQWRRSETDEFARRAIEGALDGVDIRQLPGDTEEDQAGRRIGEMHGYVAGRLRHRLRNSMLGAQVHTSRLQTLIPAASTPEAQDIVAKLNASIIRLGHELEATDVHPEHFEDRSIVLFEWIKQMNERYAARYGSIRLVTTGQWHFRIAASDYLLEIAFWNIWLNAHQAVGTDCEITIHATLAAQCVRLLISDNGRGFPGELAQVAFQERYSKKDASRGRGLLEVQEAIERLGGAVQLSETRTGDYRIKLSLPLEN